MIETWNIKQLRSHLPDTPSRRMVLNNSYYLFLLFKRNPTNRNRDNLNKLIEIFNIMNEQWNGQTKSEFQKNYKRVQDIVEKSNGDEQKAISLSRTQANKITDECKAINRAMCAKELGHNHIFEVFFQRAWELGSVTKQEYREYKLQKLGI